MDSAVPDSCCKSYELTCAEKPYGKHPSNIFYKVISSSNSKKRPFHHVGLFICTLSVLSFAFNYSWFCYRRCRSTSGKIDQLTRWSFFNFFFFLKILTIILLIWLIKRIEKLAAFSYVVTPPARRLSNEITYYPIQSSVK